MAKKLSTVKCQRKGCPKFTSLGPHGFPRSFCGNVCFRKGNKFGSFGVKTDKPLKK